MKKNRGEIGSIITLVFLAIMTVGIITSVQLANKKTEVRTLAAPANCAPEPCTHGAYCTACLVSGSLEEVWQCTASGTWEFKNNQSNPTCPAGPPCPGSQTDNCAVYECPSGCSDFGGGMPECRSFSHKTSCSSASVSDCGQVDKLDDNGNYCGVLEGTQCRAGTNPCGGGPPNTPGPPAATDTPAVTPTLIPPACGEPCYNPGNPNSPDCPQDCPVCIAASSGNGGICGVITPTPACGAPCAAPGPNAPDCPLDCSLCLQSAAGGAVCANPNIPTVTPGGPILTPGGPTLTPVGPTVTPGGPTLTPPPPPTLIPTITPDGPTITPGGPPPACGVACNAPGSNVPDCPQDCNVCLQGTNGNLVCAFPEVAPVCGAPCTTNDQCPLDCSICVPLANGQGICSVPPACGQLCIPGETSPLDCPQNCVACAAAGNSQFVCQVGGLTPTPPFACGNLTPAPANQRSRPTPTITRSPTGYLGTDNQEFENMYEKWKKGQVSTEEMSRFIANLARVPGLQKSTCDPTKGECNTP